MFYKCTSLKELYLSTFKYRYKVDFDKYSPDAKMNWLWKLKNNLKRRSRKNNIIFVMKIINLII